MDFLGTDVWLRGLAAFRRVLVVAAHDFHKPGTSWAAPHVVSVSCESVNLHALWLDPSLQAPRPSCYTNWNPDLQSG